MAHLPDLAVVVQRYLPGDELVIDLSGPVAAARRGAEVARAAQALAALHGGRVPAGRPRPIERELNRFVDRATAIRTVDRAAGEHLLELANELVGWRPVPGALSLVHGDCKPSQFLMAEDRVAILDLDHCGLADPAYDVGNFVSSLRQGAIRADGGGDGEVRRGRRAAPRRPSARRSSRHTSSARNRRHPSSSPRGSTSTSPSRSCARHFAPTRDPRCPRCRDCVWMKHDEELRIDGGKTVAAVDTSVSPRSERTGRRRASRHAKRSDTQRAFALVRRYHGGNKPYVLGFVMLVLEAGTAILEPFPIAYTIDFVTGEQPSLRERGFPAFLANERVETILLLGLAIILIAAVNKGADSLAEVYLARGGRELGYRIRVTMYDRLQRLSMAFHDKRRTGDVLTRVTGDVLVVEEFVVASLSNIVASALLLVGSFAVLLYRSWLVALIAVVVVPILAVVANYFSLRLKRVSKEQRSKEGDLASTAQEMLSSIRLVQSYGRGHVDLENFSKQSDQSMRASLKIATIQAQFSFAIAVFEGVTIAGVVWLSFWLIEAGTITPGTLVLFVLLIQNMFKPSRKIVSEWYQIGKLIASTERIDELLERHPTVEDNVYRGRPRTSRAA